MRKVSVLLLGLVLASSAAAAEPPIQLSASPQIIIVAHADERAWTILSGVVASGREGEDIVFEGRQCGTPAFVPVHRAKAQRGGVFREQIIPVITTTYRVRAGNAVSAPVLVQARPGIARFEQLSRNRFEVHTIAFRFFDGAVGRFERFNGSSGKWTLVRRVTLRRESAPRGASMAFSGAMFRARVPKGTTVRFVLPRSETGRCYLAGYSRIFNTWR